MTSVLTILRIEWPRVVMPNDLKDLLEFDVNGILIARGSQPNHVEQNKCHDYCHSLACEDSEVFG